MNILIHKKIYNIWYVFLNIFSFFILYIAFADILGGMFGGGRRGGQPRERKVKEMVEQIDVTLEELYTGKTKKLKYERQKVTEIVEGKGTDTKNCKKCKGHGMIEKVVQLAPGFISSQRGVCPDCNGEGKTYENLKIGKEKKTIEVPIEQGAPNDHYVRFSGDGNEVPGVHPGDLLVAYKVAKHGVFDRKGADLYIKRKISLYEALTGVSFNVKHLDGKNIDITTMPNQVITPDLRLQLQGLGMPFHKDPMSHGNLYVDFEVEFPKGGQIKNAEKLKDVSIYIY